MPGEGNNGIRRRLRKTEALSQVRTDSEAAQRKIWTVLGLQRVPGLPVYGKYIDAGNGRLAADGNHGEAMIYG